MNSGGSLELKENIEFINTVKKENNWDMVALFYHSAGNTNFSIADNTKININSDNEINYVVLMQGYNNPNLGKM